MPPETKLSSLIYNFKLGPILSSKAFSLEPPIIKLSKYPLHLRKYFENNNLFYRNRNCMKYLLEQQN